MAESQIQTILLWNTGDFKRKQTSQIQTFVKHAHLHTLTHITQCQIKITQGHFQGCIYNHNDMYSIFEVAEVKEQTTAQGKKQVLALTPSPLFGDTLSRAQGHVLKRHVFHREWRSVASETWLTTLQRSLCWEILSTTEVHGLNHCISWTAVAVCVFCLREFCWQLCLTCTEASTTVAVEDVITQSCLPHFSPSCYCW